MESTILKFNNLEDGKIAYNPTIPFQHEGKEYIAVRVEPLDSEESEILFAYKETENGWYIDSSIPPIPLQDPSLVKIGNNVLLAGVHVEKKGKWRTDFYYGPNISQLEKIASGPWNMKDIRLVELKDKIGIFTRPKGGKFGRGKIGYLEINSIDELKELSENDWYSAELLQGLFKGKCGVNQVLRLSDDKLGIIGHVAHETCQKGEKQSYYYAMSFLFNPKTRKYSEFKIIARREDFPHSFSKRSPELDDVLFPAGFDNENNLYCGLSDFCVGKKKIENPFVSN